MFLAFKVQIVKLFDSNSKKKVKRSDVLPVALFFYDFSLFVIDIH